MSAPKRAYLFITKRTPEITSIDFQKYNIYPVAIKALIKLEAASGCSGTGIKLKKPFSPNTIYTKPNNKRDP